MSACERRSGRPILALWVGVRAHSVSVCAWERILSCPLFVNSAAGQETTVLASGLRDGPRHADGRMRAGGQSGDCAASRGDRAARQEIARPSVGGRSGDVLRVHARRMGHACALRACPMRRGWTARPGKTRPTDSISFSLF